VDLEVGGDAAAGISAFALDVKRISMSPAIPTHAVS